MSTKDGKTLWKQTFKGNRIGSLSGSPGNPAAFYTNGLGPKWLLLTMHAAAVLGIQVLIRANARWPGNRPVDFFRHF